MSRAGSPCIPMTNGHVHTIGVLPFRDLSVEWDQQHFSVGLVEEITVGLARVPGLQVASTTSARRWDKQGLELSEVARRLDVQHLVHGSVARDGDWLQVAVQLVYGADLHVLWSERYEREVGETFAIQEHIVRTIAASVTGHADELPDDQQIVVRGTDNPYAYSLQLQGRYHRARRNRWSMEIALEAFQRSLALDPDYALAHAGIADCHTAMAMDGLRPGIETGVKARLAAAHAVARAPTLAEAHRVTGDARAFIELDPAAGEVGLREAIRLHPRNAAAYASLAMVCSATGRRAAAIDAGVCALELEPDAAPLHAIVADAWHWLGEADRAERCNALAIALDRDSSAPYRLRAVQLWQRGAQIAARDAAAWAVASGARQPVCVATLGLIAGATGQMTQAEAALEELQARAQHEYISPLFLADVLFGLGRADEAIGRMLEAYAERSGLLFRLCAPEYQPLCAQAAFVTLLRSIGVAVA